MKLDRLIVTVPRHQIGTILLGLADRFEAGLTPEDIERFSVNLQNVLVGEDVLIEPVVRLDGEEWPFVVDAFARPEDALEVIFMAPAAFIDVVQDELRKTRDADDAAPVRVSAWWNE